MLLSDIIALIVSAIVVASLFGSMIYHDIQQNRMNRQYFEYRDKKKESGHD